MDVGFVGSTIVDGTMTTGQVGLAVVRRHFGAMLSKFDGTLDGSDPEDLHDMRVATRRVRAALSLFQASLADEVLATRDDFRWLGGVLGEVRDLDVQLEHLEEWKEWLPEERRPSLDGLRASLASRRADTRAALVQQLHSERYTRFVASCGALLLHPPEPEQDALVVDAAPVLVERRMRAFRKASAELDADDLPEAFHLARIRGKRLRYAIEFFGPVYGKPAKDAAAKVVEVQDLLGLHQDMVVAMGLVDGYAAEAPSAEAFALGMFRATLEAKARELRLAFSKLQRAVRGKEWHDLHQAMQSARTPPEPATEGPANPER